MEGKKKGKKKRKGQGGKKEVEKMLQSGKISQDQLNKIQSMANQFQGLFK